MDARAWCVLHKSNAHGAPLQHKAMRMLGSGRSAASPRTHARPDHALPAADRAVGTTVYTATSASSGTGWWQPESVHSLPASQPPLVDPLPPQRAQTAISTTGTQLLVQQAYATRLDAVPDHD